MRNNGNSVIESGALIKVEVISPFTMLDKNGTGMTPLAYALNNEAGSVTSPGTFATFTADRTENGSAEVDTGDIISAGAYKGTMNFTISYE